MAETLETLRARMQTWMDANTTRLPDAVANDCLNLTQRELCRKHDFRFNETSDTFATVIGTASYALPTGWSRPLRMWYIDPDTNAVRDVDYLHKEEFDRRYPDSTLTSKPSHYMVWGQNILLGKTPDRVLTIHRDYYIIVPDLADGIPANSNDFTANAWEVLFFGALVWAHGFGFEDARMPLWEQAYRRGESDLVAEHRRAWSSGRVAQSQEPG